MRKLVRYESFARPSQAQCKKIILGLLPIWLCITAVARGNGWIRVEALQPLSRLRLLLFNGQTVEGTLWKVSTSAIVINSGYGPHGRQVFSRQQIRRIDRIRSYQPLNQGKWMGLGALIGGVAAIIVDKAKKSTRNGSGWVIDSFLGAAGGALVGLFLAGFHLIIHPSPYRMIYRSSGPKPPSPLHTNPTPRQL